MDYITVAINQNYPAGIRRLMSGGYNCLIEKVMCGQGGWNKENSAKNILSFPSCPIIRRALGTDPKKYWKLQDLQLPSHSCHTEGNIERIS